MKKINSILFKKSLSKFTTGVTIITINKDGVMLGKTVNSFAALSLKPTLVLFSLDKKSSSIEKYLNAKNIGIKVYNLKGDRNNIKITYKEDLNMGKSIINNKNKEKI